MKWWRTQVAIEAPESNFTMVYIIDLEWLFNVINTLFPSWVGFSHPVKQKNQSAVEYDKGRDKSGKRSLLLHSACTIRQVAGLVWTARCCSSARREPSISPSSAMACRTNPRVQVYRLCKLLELSQPDVWISWISANYWKRTGTSRGMTSHSFLELKI